MSRPTVDVVVPFVGSHAERRVLVERMSELDLADGDTLTVVDNGPTLPVDLGSSPVVVHAPDLPTSYHARNVGARRGSAHWILFLDADVIPVPGLLDRCFAAPLPERAGIIAGGIRDETPERPESAPLAARYAALRAPMSDERTLHHPRGYAQTANAAFRRTAFEVAGGFDERARSGGDADLCFRLADAGWALLHRPEALVVHRNRTSLRALLRQRVRHGAGSAWVDRRHPGTMPARDTRAFVAHQLADMLRQALRLRRPEATMALIDVLVGCAYLLGRRLGNEPPPRSGRP